MIIRLGDGLRQFNQDAQCSSAQPNPVQPSSAPAQLKLAQPSPAQPSPTQPSSPAQPSSSPAQLRAAQPSSIQSNPNQPSRRWVPDGFPTGYDHHGVNPRGGEARSAVVKIERLLLDDVPLQVRHDAQAVKGEVRR